MKNACGVVQSRGLDGHQSQLGGGVLAGVDTAKIHLCL